VSAATETAFAAADGWPIGALLRRPAGDPAGDSAATSPGVVTVPASRHERDAWTQTATVLAARGFTVLQLDIRGRGASANSHRYSQMGPAERGRVALDVQAAVEHLAADGMVDPSKLGLLVEQDTAADALEAIAGDRRVRAIGVLSARSSSRCADAIGAGTASVYGLVSSEDREGLRATVDAYLASPDGRSRIEIFRGLGVGITMASVLQFEDPQARPLEERLADWLARVLGGQSGSMA
jgi:dienelactone hydrolase